MADTVTEWIKLTTPFVTFFLGYATKAYTDWRESRRLLVDELVKLAGEWYEAVRKVAETQKFGERERDVERANFEYETSRGILPRYSTLLQRLAGYRSLRALHEEADGFRFELIYMKRSFGVVEAQQFRDFPLPRFVASSVLYLAPAGYLHARDSADEGKTLCMEELLESLDRRLQRLAALSGKQR